MKTLMTTAFALVLFLLLSGKAQAQNFTNIRGYSERPHFFIGTSYVNISRSKNAYEDFRVEYRFSEKFASVFRPFLGTTYTVKQDAYFYAGSGAELFLSNSFYLFPSFAAGWFKQGRGVELGYPLEFREGIEFVIKFTQEVSASLGIFHMSNATLARYKHKRNPGQEIAALGISMPVFTY